MAVTFHVYNSFLDKINDSAGNADFLVSTIKLALLTSAYTLDIDADEVWTDLSGDEASGTGYTAGGATLASKTRAVNDTTDLAKFDAADVTWNPVTLTNARYGILYSSSGAKPLIACINFGANYSPAAQVFTVAWHADGIFKTRQGS